LAGLANLRSQECSLITRYALFEGSIKAGQVDAFRKAVLDELVPMWQIFPGVLDIRVSFAEERDPGSPELVMILAVDYPNRVALATALASEARQISRAATERMLPQYFSGRIHHHVTEVESFPGLVPAT
jgi:hypothetical protein